MLNLMLLTLGVVMWILVLTINSTQAQIVGAAVSTVVLCVLAIINQCVNLKQQRAGKTPVRRLRKVRRRTHLRT